MNYLKHVIVLYSSLNGLDVKRIITLEISADSENMYKIL